MKRNYLGYNVRRQPGGYGGRKRPGGMRAAVLTFLFWAVSGLIMISFLHGGPAHLIEAKSDDVAKMYIGSVFPTVSRGSEARETMGSSLTPAGSDSNALLNANQSKGIFKSMVGSMFPAAEVMDDDDRGEQEPGVVLDTGNTDTNTDAEKKPDNSATDGAVTQDSGTTDTSNTPDTSDTPDLSTTNVNSAKPLVIIYHTHATESYQPVSDGNFHSLNEYGTVREVGDAMTKELEAKGIQVIHDKTINDSPSYNQSYTRSLETVKNLMKKYPSASVIIDLHRDAAGYSGNTAKTTAIGKNSVAKYNLVVGMGNPNVDALIKFGDTVNKKAEDMYPGFGGKIIEKKYKFNEYVLDHYMLLEIGNNQNTIDEAKISGKYFADVLAAVIKDMK